MVDPSLQELSGRKPRKKRAVFQHIDGSESVAAGLVDGLRWWMEKPATMSRAPALDAGSQKGIDTPH